jgi:hypothetical protein
VHGKKTHSQRRKRRERGQALLEFAFVVPIFLVLTFGIVDFGWALKSWITVTNAAREGARFGTVGWPAGSYPTDCNTSSADDITVVGRTCTAVADNLDHVRNVSVTCQERNGIGVDCGGTGQGETGDSVVVTIDYSYDFITPLGSFIGGLIKHDCDGVEADICMHSSTDMRLE